MIEKIAIIIPVYNAEKYIKKCINSIKNQTIKNWILIIVNDGSTDQSGKIVDKIAKSDERIIVIHQNNKGSVDARKTGVMAEQVENCEWITFCDADDQLPDNALEKLYKATKKYPNSDMVCGLTQRQWRSIKIPIKSKTQCFQSESPVYYSHEDVINKLFISYYGITNFPVSLWGKLFRTKDIIEAHLNKDIKNIKFMGDDLSISIQIVPKVLGIVIIPDIVYFYRMGGGTSKFMPYLMEDFLKLYQYKKKFIAKYSMPQNAEFYMNIELMNITKTHFLQCIRKGRLSKDSIMTEIAQTCNSETVYQAAIYLENWDSAMSEYIHKIVNKDYEGIYDDINNIIFSERWKYRIKEIIKKL